MVESKGRGGPLRVRLCLVKAGKPRPREQQGLQTPDSCSPACNWGSQAQPPLHGHSPLSCKFFREGRGQPARSNRGDAEVRSPEATAGDGSQSGVGGHPGCLPSVCLSVCLCAGSGLQGTLCRLSCSPPSLVPGPPCRPPVRMSDGCAPPQAPGPRPGSRSLAADTVCFPARDAHPRHRPFLLAPPTPMGLPGGPGCRTEPAFGSQSDGQKEPSPTLTCTP